MADVLEMKKYKSDTVHIEMQNLDLYKNLNEQALEEKFFVVVNEQQAIQSHSLSAMKTGEERVHNKDRDAYKEKQRSERNAMREELESRGLQVAPEKVEALTEYKQLMDSAGLFEKEISSTVRDTMRKHPGFMGQLNEADRTEKLTRLLTAFLPQRDVLMNPPTKRQKKAVDAFLKSFKKDPAAEITRMQASQEDSRTHKDLGDPANAAASYRLLYCEMRKREILSEVYPLACSQTTGYEEKAKQVSEYGGTVDAYRVMLENMMKACGIEAPIPDELQKNRSLFETVNANLMTDKEAALERYLGAFMNVRRSERKYSSKKRTALNNKLTEAAGVFDENRNYDNEALAVRSYLANTESVYAADTELRTVPFSETGEKIAVKSDISLIENKLSDKLILLAREMEYTRYRAEGLKRVKAGGDITKEYLETRREKETVRMSYQKKRAGELSGFLRALRENRMLLERIKTQDIGGLTDEERRYKAIYMNELQKEVETEQEDLALDKYAKVAKLRVDKALDDYLPDTVKYQEYDGDKYDARNYKISKKTINYTEEALKVSKKDRVWLNRYEAYKEQINKEKRDWNIEREEIRRKNVFYSHIGKDTKTFDEVGKRQAIKKNLKVRDRVAAQDNRLRSLVNKEIEEKWAELSDLEKKKVFSDRFTIDLEEVTGEEISTVVNEESFQLVVCALYPDLYREWAKYGKYHGNDIYADVNAKDRRQRGHNVIWNYSVGRMDDEWDIDDFYGQVKKDINALRDDHFNISVSAKAGLTVDYDRIRKGEGVWGRALYKRIALMQSEIETGKIKKKEADELAEQIRIMTPEFLKTIDETNSDLDELVAGFKEKDQSALRRLDKHKTYIDRVYQNRSKYMNPEVMDGFQKLKGRLDTLLVDNMAAYYEATRPETETLERDMRELSSLLERTADFNVDGAMDRLEEKINKLSFGEGSEFLNEKLMERERDLSAKKAILGELRKYVEDERSTGRPEAIKDIRQLSGRLTVPPTPEESRLMSEEDLLLRRVSSLVMLCSDYIDKYRDKAQVFGRKRDYEYVNNTLSELGDKYMLQLADKFKSDDYADSKGDMLFIGNQSRDYTNVADYHKYDQKFNEENEGVKNLEEVPPQYRYYLKYAKAYTMLCSYQESGWFHGVKDFFTSQKTKDEAENTKKKARQVTSFLENSVFMGLYTGLETEEEENERFFPSAYKHYEKTHKGVEEDEKKQYEEAVRERELAANDEKVSGFYNDIGENEELIKALEALAGNAEKVKTGGDDIGLSREETEKCLEDIEAIRLYFDEYAPFDLLNVETTDQRLISLRENIGLIESVNNKYIERQNKADVENINNEIKKQGISPERFHKAFNRRVLGEKSNLKELSKTESQINAAYNIVINLRNKYPGYESDEKTRTAIDLTLISLQYNETIIKSKKIALQKKGVDDLMAKYLERIKNAGSIEEAKPEEGERLIAAAEKLSVNARKFLNQVEELGLLTSDMEMVYETDDAAEYQEAKRNLDLLAGPGNSGAASEIRSRFSQITKKQVSKDLRSIKGMRDAYTSLESVEERKTLLWKMGEIYQADKELMDKYDIDQSEYKELDAINAFVNEKLEIIGADDVFFVSISNEMKPMTEKLRALKDEAAANKLEFGSAQNMKLIEELSESYRKLYEDERVKEYLASEESIAIRKEAIRQLGEDIRQFASDTGYQYEVRLMKDVSTQYVDITKSANELIEKKDRLTGEELEKIESLKAALDTLFASDAVKELEKLGAEGLAPIRETTESFREKLDNRVKADEQLAALQKKTEEWNARTDELTKKYSGAGANVDPEAIREIDEHLKNSAAVKSSSEYANVLGYGFQMGNNFGPKEMELRQISAGLKSSYLKNEIGKLNDEYEAIRQEIDDYKSGRKSAWFSSNSKKIAAAKERIVKVMDKVAELRTGDYYMELLSNHGNMMRELEVSDFLPLEQKMQNMVKEGKN